MDVFRRDHGEQFSDSIRVAALVQMLFWEFAALFKGGKKGSGASGVVKRRGSTRGAWPPQTTGAEVGATGGMSARPWPELAGYSSRRLRRFCTPRRRKRPTSSRSARFGASLMCSNRFQPLQDEAEDAGRVGRGARYRESARPWPSVPSALGLTVAVCPGRVRKGERNETQATNRPSRAQWTVWVSPWRVQRAVVRV